jgi:Domain of unknown function (DUF4407)
MLQTATNPTYQHPVAGKTTQFLWWAAGADKEILRRCTFSDHVKAMCLGGIVLATGVMAAIAGGYAFYIVFEPKGAHLDPNAIHYPTMAAAAVFGLFWGAMIFNLDRYIVASTGKGDGTEKMTGQELINALPRIIMGIILSFTISKPMEIRIFKPEIDVEISKAQIKKAGEFKKEIEAMYAAKIKDRQDGIAKLENESTAAQVESKRLSDEAMAELDGTGGSKGVGKGPVYLQKMARSEEQKALSVQLQTKNAPKIAELQTELAGLKKEKEQELANASMLTGSLDGLLQRILLSHEIAGFWISLVITLVFMAVELTPIFFKLMLTKSPYDYLEENEKELIQARAGIERTHEYYYDEKTKEQVEKVHFHQPAHMTRDNRKLIEVQQRLSDEIMRQWEEAELANIKANPEQYVAAVRRQGVPIEVSEN